MRPFSSSVPKSRVSSFIFAILLFPVSLFVVAITTNFSIVLLEYPTMLKNDADSSIPRTAKSSSSRKKKSIYIPGAGYSGFFYSLGRLHAVTSSSSHQSKNNKNNNHHEYYCFSAGCLALVATMVELSVDQAFDVAKTSRDRWVNGEIGRYDVVKNIVDILLSQSNDDFELEKCEMANVTTDTSNEIKHPDEFAVCSYNESTSQKNPVHKIQHKLPQINVITTKWENYYRFSQHIQKPTSIDQLKEMLIQTTWIPMFTGSSLGKIDEKTGHFYNDGVFAGLFRNVFEWISQSHHARDYHNHDHSLGLPLNIDLLSNVFNTFLDKDKAVHFWNEGVKRGTHKMDGVSWM